MCRAPVEQVVQIRLEGTPSSPHHTGVVRVKRAGLPEEIGLGTEEETDAAPPPGEAPPRAAPPS
jgi:hypothetical protein